MELKDFVQGSYGTMYYVRDMKKAVAFYTDLLGKTPASESPEWASFDLNGTNLCLHLAEGEIDGKGMMIFSAKGLKNKVDALKKMGVEIEKDYHQVCEGGYSVDFRDPSGNRMSLFEYTGQ